MTSVIQGLHVKTRRSSLLLPIQNILLRLLKILLTHLAEKAIIPHQKLMTTDKLDYRIDMNLHTSLEYRINMHLHPSFPERKQASLCTDCFDVGTRKLILEKQFTYHQKKQ